MRRLWFVGIAIVLIGCAAQSPETDEPILATPIAEATEPSITVTDVPAPTLPLEISMTEEAPTEAPTAIETPSGTRVEPLLTLVEELAFGVSDKLMGWSPSGAWVWYIGHHNTYFYQPETGKDCWLNRWENDGTVMDNYWSWLAGDRLLVRDQDADTLVVISDPCVELTEGARVEGFNAPFVRLESVSPDYQRVILSTPQQVYIYYAESGGLLPIQLDVNAENLLTAIWSPQGSRVALIKTEPQGETDIHTWIIDPATGGLIDEIQWGYFGGDPPRWPTWITENRLLFYTTKQGPLMLTVGQGVTNVAEELFGLDCTVIVCQLTFVYEAKYLASGYHLILTNQQPDVYLPMLIYHAEDPSRVDQQGTWDYGSFSPDATMILLSDRTYNGSIYAIRGVESPGMDFITLPDGAVFWHPYSQMLIVTTTSSITAYGLYGSLLREWWAEGGAFANIRTYSWSPNGNQLAVVGSDNALYLIEIP